ncbi:unnamed protein product [Rhizophagus irregularis]|nr:unnamed protein product [Rhizophagus irregularis]
MIKKFTFSNSSPNASYNSNKKKKGKGFGDRFKSLRKLNDGSIQTKKIGDFHHSCNKFNIVEYLWRLRGLLSKSHTGEFLSETIEEIIDEIGDIFHQGGSALKETKACEVPLENSKCENPETPLTAIFSLHPKAVSKIWQMLSEEPIFRTKMGSKCSIARTSGEFKSTLFDGINEEFRDAVENL